MSLATADLSDAWPDLARVADPIFRDFGGRLAFHGPVTTLKCHEDNSLVRAALEEAGEGRVLVVDGGGSLRCALLGGNLAALAVDHGWAGVVVWGCLRDTDEIAALPLGVKALAPHPRKSHKRNQGLRDVPVTFAGVTFRPGEYLYADGDGLLIAVHALG